MNYPATQLSLPDPNPFNIQAVKQYVFNETGNIMMASTELGSEQVAQSVRDVFSEVAVFFAAMTKAISTSIDPKSKQPYSIYDYQAIRNVIDGSGLFVQVTSEDVNYSSDSWGATLSEELIQALLGLATGEGELSFAQGMISAIGQRGVTVGASSWSSDSRVGNIIFICEYLLGMPIVSAMVVYVDAKENSQTFNVGPCITETSTNFNMTMHKDTYMFVTPAFIKQYSGDLLSVEKDLQFQEFVGYLQDLVLQKSIITSVDTMDGKPAPSSLVSGQTYALIGNFLLGGDTSAQPVVKFVGQAGSATIKLAEAQPDVVTFTVTGPLTTACPIGLYANSSATTPYVQSPSAFTVG